MRGQWRGEYQGDNVGRILIDVDELEDHYEAVAYLIPNLVSGLRVYLPTVTYVKTYDKSNNQDIEVNVYPLNVRNWAATHWDMIKSEYPEDVIHSNKSKIKFSFDHEQLKFEANTDIGVHLSANIKRAKDTEDSNITSSIMNWDQFKADVSANSKKQLLFRGQQRNWKLSTSFHRKGRFSINRFINQDVNQLHRVLSSLTKHLFDLSIPEQNGAFLNLLQHHGYPTPLLDWSRSPYVAAFFAFRNLDKINTESHVRIFKFDEVEWRSTFENFSYLELPFPHVSVLESISVENPRLIPQQSVTTVTNVPDIESYIKEKEIEAKKVFLSAIDIPNSEREKALLDLRLMGITTGSMFPSLDGICEEMRERNFDR